MTITEIQNSKQVLITRSAGAHAAQAPALRVRRVLNVGIKNLSVFCAYKKIVA
jgi:hypothetical protein